MKILFTSVGRRVELLQAYFNPHFRKGSDCNIPQKHLSIFMKYL